MAETEFGIRKAKTFLPVRDLLVAKHDSGRVVVGWPAFGPNYFSTNVQEMGKKYFHSDRLPEFSFVPLTTAKSVSVAAHDVELTRREILDDPRWLQLGYIVRTGEGVFANPPNKNGKPITDEAILRSYLDGTNETNGIYVVRNTDGLVDFGFAPYESFQRGEQESGDFAVNPRTNGLARLLQHTQGEVADNLGKIASPKLYSEGVVVWGFNSLKEPVLSVACLVSIREHYTLGVGSDGDNFGYYHGGGGGFTFGGLSESDAGKIQ